MSLRIEQWACQGPAGMIDCTVDHPEGEPAGWALVLHPHPLYGGTRDNKVVTTLARTCVQHGLLTVRPNFRGVGKSAGTFDKAIGETDDMMSCVEQVLAHWPQLSTLPWVLAGFSFGSAVAARLHDALAARGSSLPARLVLVGCAVQRFSDQALALPADTLVVHGEADEVVPLPEALVFAGAHDVPVTVVPQASHFFHGKLIALRQVLENAAFERPVV